jgi:hypothetical protein
LAYIYLLSIILFIKVFSLYMYYVILLMFLSISYQLPDFDYLCQNYTTGSCLKDCRVNLWLAIHYTYIQRRKQRRKTFIIYRVIFEDRHQTKKDRVGCRRISVNVTAYIYKIINFYFFSKLKNGLKK